MARNLILLLVFALNFLPLCGQNAGQATDSGAVLRTTSQAVVLDVLVTNNGAPVSGLVRSDFNLLEDGKPQGIDFFEQHATGGQRMEVPALPPNVYSNQPPVAPDDAATVWLLDSLDTERADQAQARRQAEGFVANLQPGMRVAIYALNSRLQLVQGFTSDRELLRAALAKDNAAPETSASLRGRTEVLEDNDSVTITGDARSAEAQARSLQEYANMRQGRQTTTVLNALQQLARALAAIPGRKNLIWISDVFPVALYPEGDNRTTLMGERGHEVPQVLSDTVNLLTASRVALYPVSARGLMNDRTANADNHNASIARNPNQESTAIQASISSMEALARNTGGQALYTSNDLADALTHEVRNGTQYYTLAYTPTNRKADGRFHRIEVKLSNGQYKLAYRRGYYASAESATPSKQSTDPLAPLLANGLPDATSIVFRIRVTAEPPPAGGAARAGGNAKLPGPASRYKVDFLIPVESLTFNSSTGGTHEAKIRVAMVAYGADGKPANWTGGEMKLSLNEASFARAQRTGIAAPMEIDLPQGDLSLVTGIWDAQSQRAGTLRIPVRSAP